MRTIRPAEMATGVGDQDPDVVGFWNVRLHGWNYRHADGAISFTQDGTVAAVGTTGQVLAAQRTSTRWIDGEGLVAVPGFVDPHVHIRAAASARLSGSCEGMVTLVELAQAVADSARGLPDGRWISLAGFESASFGACIPDRHALDAMAPRHPLRIRHRSLHAWLLNTRAADLVAERLGERPPDGLVIDRAGEIRAAIGEVNAKQELEQAAFHWSREMLDCGVVALVDAGGANNANDVTELMAWHRRGILVQEVRAFLGEDAPADALAQDGVVGIKILPESDHAMGLPLARRFELAWAKTGLVAIHCADVATLGAIIDALESIPVAARRVIRIEHASICPPDWVPRIAALGCARIVTQPAFLYAHGDRYMLDVPELMHSWLYRVRSWRAAGVPVAIGSDHPAGPADPLVACEAAVTRQTRSGALLGPREAVDLTAALSLVTWEAADVSGLKGFGRLVIGERGSVVLVDLGDGPGNGAPPRVRSVMLNGVLGLNRSVHRP